jgi:hypothetical protein
MPRVLFRAAALPRVLFRAVAFPLLRDFVPLAFVLRDFVLRAFVPRDFVLAIPHLRELVHTYPPEAALTRLCIRVLARPQWGTWADAMRLERHHLAMLLVAALLAGCGGDDGPNEQRFDGDAQDVAAVVDELQRYARLNDGASICEELLTPQLESQVERASELACPERINEQLGDADTTITVRRVSVDGPHAMATLTKSKLTAMEFVKRDGEWRINRLRG